AADGDLLAVDDLRRVGCDQACVSSGGPGLNLGDLDAGRDAELGGEGRVDRGHADAEVGVLDDTARDELGGDRLHGVGGNREADAVVPARMAFDLRVDADEL